jgi:hypothetical protein
VCGHLLPGKDRRKVTGEVGIRIESEHGVGLGQFSRKFPAVPLGQAANGDHGLGTPGLLERSRLEQGVDGVLLGRLDEPAGVDQCDIGVCGIGNEAPSGGREAPSEFLRVDLVARAPEGHQGHAAAVRRRHAHGAHSSWVVAVSRA